MAKLIKSLHKLDHGYTKMITINRLSHENDNSPKFQKPSINQSKLQAEQMIHEAKEEAEMLLKEVEKEIEEQRMKLNEEENALESRVRQALKDAENRGYQEGFEKGLAEGEKAIRQDVEEARRIVKTSQNDYLEKIQEAEPIIVKMAVQIARKTIGEAVDKDPDYWISLIKTVLKEVKEYEDIRLYVNPNKYEMVVQHKKELQGLLNDATDIYIYPNQELTDEGCLIETPFGTIDAAIDSQLSEIKAQLLDYIEESDQ